MGTRRSRSMPPEISVPLRDLLRGVRTATEISEEVLRPLGGLLPGTLRRMLHDTLEAADRAGRQATHFDAPEPAEIAAAADVLANGEGALPALTRVLAYGLERALAADAARHLMISETVASMALRGALAGGGGRAARAARMVQALSRAHVAGRMPGTGLALDAAEQARIDRALIGVMLWLMAERAATPAEEARLLELSVGLAQALSDELDPLMSDAEALARELDQLAGMI